MSSLRPVPFDRLVARAFEELPRNGSIFDLPARRFFTGDPRHDASVTVHGRRISAPLGPSAGPHTQMAQNIVLAWLGGSRIFELKTVQERDALAIPRPCIEIREAGLNVEWSQELRLEESLAEYVKASMLIEMLEASGAVRSAPGYGSHLFDMSVGYDLDGIRGDRVVGFMKGLLDARASIDALRMAIPERWRALRDLDFTSCIAPSVTVSTFHGCPVEEIERIADFLMSEIGVDCTIKLNPTLLGATSVLEILQDRLGYTDLVVPPSAFDNDPEWEDACEIVARLQRRARALGRGFAVKLTNTLIVENRSSFLPASEKLAYLSGPPLHVIAMYLVRMFRREFGGALPISFSAGIDRFNYPDAVRLGLAPVTVCTDLLRQGGYGRLRSYAEELSARMSAEGATTSAEFRSEDVDAYIDRLECEPRYRKPGTPSKRRRAQKVFVDDCSMCDLCIPACPNDAIFRIPALESSKDHDHQIACLVDLCNECGNCETFCPDGGAPHRDKYRVALSGEWRSGDYIERAVLDRSRVNYINCLSLEDA